MYVWVIDRAVNMAGYGLRWSRKKRRKNETNIQPS